MTDCLKTLNYNSFAMGFTYCAVKGCKSVKKNKEKKLSFFSLPQEQRRRYKWLELIGRPDLMNDNIKPKNYRVCAKHFDKSALIYTVQLKREAIPTKYCPDESSSVLLKSNKTTNSTDGKVEKGNTSNNIPVLVMNLSQVANSRYEPNMQTVIEFEVPIKEELIVEDDSCHSQ